MNKLVVLFSLLFTFFITERSNAQAYDGSEDRKIFLGATMIGDCFGFELQGDEGMSDLVSYGGKVIFLFSREAENLDEYDRAAHAFSNLDLSMYLRFHFSEVMRLSEKTDPFLGLDFSLKALGAHAGYKYNFGETLGIYAQAGYSFSGSFFAATSDSSEYDDFVNRFAKKTNFAVGLTFNLGSNRMY